MASYPWRQEFSQLLQSEPQVLHVYIIPLVPKMPNINKKSFDLLLGNVVIMIIMSNNVATFFQKLWHFFEHVTESKNHIIDGLLKELDESEEQYARNLKSHTEIIDQLTGM